MTGTRNLSSLKMAYHLSRKARAGLAEFQIPKASEHQLLAFQQKAVQIAAHRFVTMAQAERDFSP